MKIKLLLSALTTALLLPVGCSNDCSGGMEAMKREQEALKQAQLAQTDRIVVLETWQQQVNNNITALQGLITASQHNDHVTGVTPLDSNAGYLITFTKRAPITIYNGAKGTDGTKGAPGDAIFAQNGIDHSNPNHVAFTLADGETKIKVPKYVPLGIAFTQPGEFEPGETKTIACTVTGTVTNIVALNVPQDWKVTANISAKKITVTAPAAFDSKNADGRVTLLISGESNHLTTHSLVLKRLVAPQYAASDRLWVIDGNSVHQVWSDAIAVPECDKTNYNGNNADCRNNPGYAGHLYSWHYVNANAAKLCPTPWREPSKDDFMNLNTALNSEADNYIGIWGGAYVGYCTNNGVLYYQGLSGLYWSSTEHNSTYGYTLYYHSSSDADASSSSKYIGFTLRCVK